jgi:hypothetical protein
MGSGVDWGGDTSGYYTKPQHADCAKQQISPCRLYKAPADYAKPQNNLQRSKRLYKAFEKV